MEEKRKLVQFSIILSLLNKGKPMINYEDFLRFLQLLKLRSIPKRQWFGGASWEMEKHIDHEVIKTIEVTIQNAKFVYLTCDELISMDNASWANVHSYIVQNWCHILLLLNVQHVVFGSKVDNLLQG
jgi:hypothetical protein